MRRRRCRRAPAWPSSKRCSTAAWSRSSPTPSGFHGLITRFDLLNHLRRTLEVSHDDPTPKTLGFATRVIHAGQSPDPSTGAIMPPIYATSTYVQQSPGVHKGLDYGRSHNPTRWALRALRRRPRRRRAGLRVRLGAGRDLDRARAAATPARTSSRATTSTAAPSACSSACARAAPGTALQLRRPDRPAKLRRRAARPTRKLVWVETPTNPLLRLADLRAIAAAVPRARHHLPSADNTFASPWVQRPLELGFDIVVHSTTKYLNGHSDVIGGVAVVGNDARLDALRERLGFLQNAVGAIAGPVRQLPRAARREDAGAAHGAALQQRARARAVAASSSRRSRACTTPACRRIRSTRSRGARCAASAA